MSTKVKLRQKAISRNRQTLYLDIYPPVLSPETGKPTRREFLGFYVLDKPKTAAEKQHNKEMMQLAEQIRQKREMEYNKPEIYNAYEREQLRLQALGEQDFVAYFQALRDQRKGSNYDNWVSACNHFSAFALGSLPFKALTEKLCDDFKNYLFKLQNPSTGKPRLSQNSVVSYFNKFKAVLKQAYKEGYLQIDLNAKVERVKEAETQRNFLTLEELNRLAQTECNSPVLKRAALFSALTGLRFADIQKLAWQDVEHISGSGYFIHFRQQKTKGVEMMPISEQAYQILGATTQLNDPIFEGLNYSTHHNNYLSQWLGAAGITKYITFHCFRHTFATLQLSYGTDIYTVSKMLGHRSLKTTQIYAKVIDQRKIEAAEKIKLNM